ncbi:MAG TPA: GNAT family N-acetyltransferase [Candidatus Bathyarchaeia archaeon]|nr:GNAT family N-acetyltransferase [Candidatus Bathyarchaeia archaeon]
MPEPHILLQKHIPEIIQLTLGKWNQANLLSSELFDQTYIESFLADVLTDILTNHPGYGFSQNGKLISYLIGYSGIPSLKGKELGSYIPLWGHYISKNDFDTFFTLYSMLAKDWLKSDVFTHIITCLPCYSLLQENLYILGFGLLVIDAIRSLKPISIPPLKSKFLLRSMTSDDFQVFNQIEQDFCSYMQSSPTFLYTPPSDCESPLSEFIADGRRTFVVEYQGTLVAAIRGILGKSNFDLLNQPRSIGINYAYTDPKFRGFGLGTHLVNEVLKYGQDNQASYCTVDFESANLLAKRFWLAYFTPIGYSSIRKIDNRL